MGIRTAKPSDLLQIEAIAAVSPTAPQWALRDWQEMLRAEPVGQLTRTVLVAELKDTLAGFAVYTVLAAVFPPDAELESLAVAVDCRRKGIGMALLQAVADAVYEVGAEMLSLEVRAGNSAAVALYRRFGFQQTGIRRGYYTSPMEDAILMGLPLPKTGRQMSNDMQA